MRNLSFTVLGVTRMSAGYACVAGISSDGSWVRPRPVGRRLTRGDLDVGIGRELQCFDVVDVPAVRAAPHPPHLEDWEVEWSNATVASVLPDDRRAEFLRAHADGSFAPVFTGQERSLGLVEVAGIRTKLFTDDDRRRVKMNFCCEKDGPWCHRWATVTSMPDEDRLLREFDQRGVDELKKNQLREVYGAREFYVAIGLSREDEGECWPLVIGVHPVDRLHG
ncbi:MAG: dual OB domain-containing protein [Thermoleophilia bacterium]